MFRKSPASSAHLLSNGSFSLPENEARLGLEAMNLPSLVYYAAVANSAVILAEYATEGNAELPAIAAKCLENVPSLHIRFSYTTKQRRFICLLDGVFTYCAIMDEALRKSEAFSFLLKMRDAFKAFLKGRGSNSGSLTLGAHLLDEEMVPVMRNLAAPLVGVPQREKDRMEAELQAQRDAEADLEVSSPSAVAPLYEMSDQDFDSKTEEKPLGSRFPRMPLIGKFKKAKKKAKDQAKETLMENKEKAMDKGKKLEILVEGGPGAAVDKDGSTDSKGQQLAQKLAQKMWWCNTRLVIMLDILVCLFLLAVWLGVCRGTSCLKR